MAQIQTKGDTIQVMELILFIIAIVVGIYGVVRIVQGDLLLGAVLIVLALLIGPGGVSLFT